MKITLTTLALSACLLGYTTAEPSQDKKKSAPQKVEKKAKPAPKKSKETSNKKAKPAPKKSKEASSKKAKPAPRKSKEAVARERAERAKKAAATAAKKKADEGKMVKDAIAKIKELNTKKKAAESVREKAAQALRVADSNVTEIERQLKTATAILKSKATNDRQKAEQAKARRIRETEAKERSLFAAMKRELQDLKQTVDQLKKQRAEKK